MIVLGIDPGERWTGIVLRGSGSELLEWQVVDRKLVDPAADRVGKRYMDAAESAAWQMLGRHVPDLLGRTTFSPHAVQRMTAAGGVLVAVEEFADPVGFRQIPPKVLIGVGRLLGHLQRAFPTALLVPAFTPGREGKDGHGRRPLLSYPDELVTKGERAAAHRKKTWGQSAPQNSNSRHARSAWDVAGEALAATRMRTALTAEQIRKEARRGRLA